MSIGSHDQETHNPFKDMETVVPPPEHRDDETGDAVRAELSQMKEAEAKRKNRNKKIARLVASTILLGGGIFAGSKLAGSNNTDAEPTPNQPTAEAPVVPGSVEEQPSAEAPVMEAESRAPSMPSDIDRLGETLESGEPLFTNEAIQEWFRVTDVDLMGAQVFLPDYLVQHGADSNFTPNAMGYVESESEVTHGLDSGYVDSSTGKDIAISYFEGIENKFLVGGNMILSSPELFDGTADPHFGKMALRGTFGEAIDEIAAEGLDCETDCTGAMDDEAVRNFVEKVQTLPEGSVITDLYIDDIIVWHPDGIYPPGTNVQFTVRTPDGESSLVDFKLGSGIPRLAPLDANPLAGYEPSLNGPDAQSFLQHVPVDQ